MATRVRTPVLMSNYTSKFRRSISADKRQSVQGHSSITQPWMFATRTGMRVLIDNFQQAKLDSSLQNPDGSTTLRNITFDSQQRDEHTTWLKSKLRHHIVWNTFKSTYSKSCKSGFWGTIAMRFGRIPGKVVNLQSR